MGWKDAGYAGSDLYETPNINRLSKEGVVFTNAYACAGNCAPSRACLLSGQYTPRHGVYAVNSTKRGPVNHMRLEPIANSTVLAAENVTVAEALKAAGYTTGMFGKWGVGERGTNGVPEQHGFDVFYGYYHQVHAHSYYPIYLLRNSEKIYLEGNTGDFYTGRVFSHELIYQESVKFIRENKDNPFFAYLAWTPPHGRWGMPEDDPAWQKYKDRQWDAGYSSR